MKGMFVAFAVPAFAALALIAAVIAFLAVFAPR
jgi:hypothetical protein